MPFYQILLNNFSERRAGVHGQKNRRTVRRLDMKNLMGLFRLQCI